MPKFTYTGADERYYSSLGVTATPGMIADLEADPGDGRWEPTPEPKKTAAPVEPAPTNL